MPLDPRYTWSETPHSIVLQITIPGVKAASTDITVAEYFLKVNSPPYLLALDLHGALNTDLSRNVARVGSNEVYLELQKKEQDSWGALVAVGSKDAIKARRQQSLLELEQRQTAAREAAKTRKIEDDRFALQEQMKLEETERKILDQRKLEEKQRAEAAIFDTAESEPKAKIVKREPHHVSFKEASDSDDDDDDDDAREHGGAAAVGQPRVKTQVYTAASTLRSPHNIEEDDSADDDEDHAFDGVAAGKEQGRQREHSAASTSSSSSSQKKGHSADIFDADADADVEMTDAMADATNNIGDGGATTTSSTAPRQSATVKVQFTKKKFPHLAARESHDREPPMPKPQNRKALGDGSADGEGGDSSNPLWLRDRAEQFVAKKDYQAAINALDSAISIDSSDRLARTLRAQCYLFVNNFSSCVDDCDAVLSAIEESRKDSNGLLTDLSERERGQKAHLLSLKAFAYGRLGDLLAAEKTMQEAAQANPQDAELVRTLQRLKARQAGMVHKEQADRLLQDGKVSDAIAFYSLALEADGSLDVCLSNRALCYLQTKQWKQCREDATAALDLLLGAEPNPFVAPVTEAQKRKMKVKLLLRRASALVEQQEFILAESDAQEALAIERDNPAALEILNRTRTSLQEPQQIQRFQELKARADALMKEGSSQLSEAAAVYSQILTSRLKHSGSKEEEVAWFSCFANRAACYLALHRYRECVDDCNTVLKAVVDLPSRLAEALDDAQRRRWEAMILARRGAAYCYIGDDESLAKSLADYTRACELQPENAQLKGDMDRVSQQMQNVART